MRISKSFPNLKKKYLTENKSVARQRLSLILRGQTCKMPFQGMVDLNAGSLQYTADSTAKMSGYNAPELYLQVARPGGRKTFKSNVSFFRCKRKADLVILRLLLLKTRSAAYK